MSPRSALDSVSPAIEHTRRQLWPLEWSQWWRIAVIGILAGELSGFSCGGSPGMPGGSGSAPPSLPGMRGGPWAAIGTFAFVTMAAVFVLVMILVFVYINSRFRFILIDTIVQRRCQGIRAGWRKWRRVGVRFFVWQLLFQLGVMLLFGGLIGTVLLAGVGLGGFGSTQPAAGAMILGALLAIMLLASLVVVVAVTFVIAKDFMAPILAIEQAGIGAAWRRTWSIIAADKLGVAGYILVKLVLSLAAAILVGIAVLLLLIPPALIAIAAGLSMGGNIEWTPGTIITFATVGAMFVVWLVTCVALASVPFTVFFPAFSLHFLASRYEPLHVWMHSPEGPHP